MRVWRRLSFILQRNPRGSPNTYFASHANPNFHEYACTNHHSCPHSYPHVHSYPGCHADFNSDTISDSYTHSYPNPNSNSHTHAYIYYHLYLHAPTDAWSRVQSRSPRIIANPYCSAQS